jgi:hypothetical protein
MTREQSTALSLFESKVSDMIALCERQKNEINTLVLALNQERSNAILTQEKLSAAEAKYRDLLTTHVVAEADQEGLKGARQRLLKLVRKVDKCIALLNG